jgi:hypothetical protein
LPAEARLWVLRKRKKQPPAVNRMHPTAARRMSRMLVPEVEEVVAMLGTRSLFLRGIVRLAAF